MYFIHPFFFNFFCTFSSFIFFYTFRIQCFVVEIYLNLVRKGRFLRLLQSLLTRYKETIPGHVETLIKYKENITSLFYTILKGKCHLEFNLTHVYITLKNDYDTKMYRKLLDDTANTLGQLFLVGGDVKMNHIMSQIQF